MTIHRFTYFIAITLIINLTGFITYSQEFYDVSDFLKVSSESEVIYNFSSLKESIEPLAEQGRLNFNYYYLNDSAGNREIKPYNISRSVRELFEWGSEALMLGVPDTARLIYKEVLDFYPHYSPAITGIGYTFQELGHHEEAKHYFNKAIKTNPIDYMAYWGLAFSLLELNQYEESKRSILKAWILNRNSKEIQRSVKHIFDSTGYTFNNWTFTPQYRLHKTNNTIEVSYNTSWMGYAVCKAVWQYEPGFSDLRGFSVDNSMFIERECLSCLITTMQADKEKAMKDPALAAFKKALQQKFAFEFILFEILLPDKPDMAYHLNTDRIEKVVEYIIVTRSDKQSGNQE